MWHLYRWLAQTARSRAYNDNLANVLPFRFKAGGDGSHTSSMAGLQHHHRSTTKSANKSFKTKHATKSALKNQAKGKVEALERGARKTPHQQIMSKLDRRNQAKQRRLNHHADREEKASVFGGKDGAHRIIAVIPLCPNVDSDQVVHALNSSVDVPDQELPLAGIWSADIPRFKQRVQYLRPARELLQALDACRVADFVLLILSASQEVDEMGESILRCVESQGVSTVLVGVSGLDQVEPAKRRPDVVKSLKSYITHFFPAQEKVHDIGSRQDCSNVVRSLCTTMPKGIRWREDRSWMLIEDCIWNGHNVIVAGTVRGKALKADRLVQVGEWGDMQIERITAAPAVHRHRKGRTDTMAVDAAPEEQVLELPSDDQDDLAELAPEEAIMDDIGTASLAASTRKAVLLDDHHYFDEGVDDDFVRPKRLPRGTSKYQAAWYLGDVSDSGSDLESLDGDDEDGDVSMRGAPQTGPADGNFDDVMPEPTEAGAPSEYAQSEAFFDPTPEDEIDQLEAYRKQRRDEANDDLEFPDEVELHPHASAKERLARYRGLKDLRTSQWETEEDRPYEPEDWSRLLEISDYKSAKNRVLKDALFGGVKPGTRVHVHLRVPAPQYDELRKASTPTTLFSLLKHEHKRTAINLSMTLSSECEVPLKSKSPLVLQCGPRRLLINPLFSQAGNTPNNVHKFDRYLHPGRTAVATFIGPLTWGSVPCLFFQAPSPKAETDPVEDLANTLQKNGSSSARLQMIGTGTTLAPSTSRIIAKRVILTGHPYKIHKKLVTVRYMFFNSDDVSYFRALQLWTKHGRSGYMKEPLGTHGYFKATFDGKINPLDAVAVSLYKRVWPRPASNWSPGKVIEAGTEMEMQT